MKKDTLLKSMSLFSLATMMSRVLGLVRDMVIASCIPALWQDIFWAGFKIPSTFRMLFAEGALSAVFIPMLTRVREREGEAQAREYAAAIFHLLLLSVCVVTVLAILFAPFFVHHFFDFKASAVVTQMDANALDVPNLYPDQPDWRY
ncbi:MAG: lipid II flippase MurJ, partial [bacterium]|nr:lipid II flippase MurJ [bacterium]